MTDIVLSTINPLNNVSCDPGDVWNNDGTTVLDIVPGEDKLLTPRVIKTAGGFRLYYTACGIRNGLLGSIKSAFSTNGNVWNREKGYRISPDPGDRSLSPHIITLPNGLLRMYYQFKKAESPSTIRSAISKDGIKWDLERGTRIEEKNADTGSPCCVLLADGKYRLYYHWCELSDFKKKGVRNIKSAISKDGIQFTTENGIRIKQDKAFESYAVYAPEVIKIPTGWRMYYSSWSSYNKGLINTATSDDGILWNKWNKPCLIPGAAMQEEIVSEPCLIKFSEVSIHMIYEAQAQDGIWRIRSAGIPNDFKI